MNTICILAAGLGSRLKNISNFHKALLPINNKAVISHIIEKDQSPETEFVIAVGYQKDYIKEYCLASHSDRKMVFVEVDNYDGVGSGPGYSLNCCKSYLQKPFYLFCVDCIVEENLPELNYNWIGVSPVQDTKNWSTAEVVNNVVLKFKNKNINGYSDAFIGVAGIKDYDIFWNALKCVDNEFEMVSAFYNPQIYPDWLRAEYFTWNDTGTSENYLNFRKNKESELILGMSKVINELTFNVNNKCVKIFENKKVCQDRINRASLLKYKIPEISYSGDCVYAYKWVEGKTLYEVNNFDIYKNLPNWCQEHLWQPVCVDEDFNKTCYDFYYKKTYSRYNDYKKLNPDCDKIKVINGIEHNQTMDELLNLIDWDNISKGIPTTFHGDLQFENIIWNNIGNYCLIDWRDSFAGKSYGDLYYDLAKLYGGILISFNAVKHNKIKFNKTESSINYEIDTTSELQKMKLYYENWLIKNNFDLLKVRVLTGLIYLNMSPLHTQPFSDILFHHSRYLLSTTI